MPLVQLLTFVLGPMPIHSDLFAGEADHEN